MSDFTAEDKKKALQNTIWVLTTQQAFLGSLIQELTIKYSDMVPTAGITYNKKLQQFEVYINPTFFASLTNEERVAIFHHEVMHFTNKHMFRFPLEGASEEDKKIYNISGDMAINQYIPNLPKGGVDVKNWKMDDGKPFPLFQNMETYAELIKKEKSNQKGNEKTKGNVNKNLQSFQDFDSHMWDGLSEEEKHQMLEEAKKVLKRTIEKTSYSHSAIPSSIKDLLEELEALSMSINYKQILKNTIKKTVSCVDRESTWKKPNKRYGVCSPGTKIGVLPQLSMYADTSGSISVKELNLFLNIISEFLKVGSRKCDLGLWHTSLYYKKKYKLNSELNKEEVESGGTAVMCVLEDIKKSKPNLSIILTDGYYENADIILNNEIIWIISEGGNKDHPLKNIGKTILLDNLK